ncbi:MAG: hypothetical protein IPM64_06250 [Phycisphaerales bacterium]|nr:hypothetical protein [Phycisphaerales bacterium]
MTRCAGQVYQTADLFPGVDGGAFLPPRRLSDSVATRGASATGGGREGVARASALVKVGEMEAGGAMQVAEVCSIEHEREIAVAARRGRVLAAWQAFRAARPEAKRRELVREFLLSIPKHVRPSRSSLYRWLRRGCEAGVGPVGRGLGRPTVAIDDGLWVEFVEELRACAGSVGRAHRAMSARHAGCWPSLGRVAEELRLRNRWGRRAATFHPTLWAQFAALVRSGETRNVAEADRMIRAIAGAMGWAWPAVGSVYERLRAENRRATCSN